MKLTHKVAKYGPISFLLGFIVLFYFYRLLISGGDHLTTIVTLISMAVAVLPIGIPLLLLKSKIGSSPGPRQIVGGLAVAGICVAAGLLLMNVFDSRLAPAAIQSTLRSHGNVATAKVLNYELYDSASRYGNRIDPLDFNNARLIAVSLQLPDGRRTHVSIDSNYPGYALEGSINRQIVQLQLMNGELKVRYLEAAAWFVRPEVEFTSLNRPEACRLLGQTTDVECTAL